MYACVCACVCVLARARACVCACVCVRERERERQRERENNNDIDHGGCRAQRIPLDSNVNNYFLAAARISVQKSCVTCNLMSTLRSICQRLRVRLRSVCLQLFDVNE